MLFSTFFSLWKMFMQSLCSCNQDLLKQKAKIIDFQTICSSIVPKFNVAASLTHSSKNERGRVNSRPNFG